MIGFTKALSKEVASFGVRVNAVAPGIVKTDMISVAHGGAAGPDQVADPGGRFGHARRRRPSGLLSCLRSGEPHHRAGDSGGRRPRAVISSRYWLLLASLTGTRQTVTSRVLRRSIQRPVPKIAASNQRPRQRERLCNHTRPADHAGSKRAASAGSGGGRSTAPVYPEQVLRRTRPTAG